MFGAFPRKPFQCTVHRPCFRESGSGLRFSYRDPSKIGCSGNKPGQETDVECQSLFSRSNVRTVWEESLAALHPFKGGLSCDFKVEVSI